MTVSEMDPTIVSFMKNEAEVREYLRDDIKLSEPVIDAILYSTINISKVSMINIVFICL